MSVTTSLLKPLVYCVSRARPSAHQDVRVCRTHTHTSLSHRAPLVVLSLTFAFLPPHSRLCLVDVFIGFQSLAHIHTHTHLSPLHSRHTQHIHSSGISHTSPRNALKVFPLPLLPFHKTATPSNPPFTSGFPMLLILRRALVLVSAACTSNMHGASASPLFSLVDGATHNPQSFFANLSPLSHSHLSRRKLVVSEFSPPLVFSPTSLKFFIFSYSSLVGRSRYLLSTLVPPPEVLDSNTAVSWILYLVKTTKFRNACYLPQ